MSIKKNRAKIVEVDTDPSNNPGRPEDPYDYLGMHPDVMQRALDASGLSGDGGGEEGGDSSSADVGKDLGSLSSDETPELELSDEKTIGEARQLIWEYVVESLKRDS